MSRFTCSPMSSFRPAVSSALTLAMLMTSGWADTIVLKSGERIEGRVVSETDKQLTLEVQVSAGITDERKVAKADVDKVEKQSPELEAYKEIVGLQPGANSLAEADYEPRIAALQGFLGHFPSGTKTADVKTALSGFEADLKRVKKGDVKLDGQWYSKDEIQRDKVQIGGRMAFGYMKSQAAAGDILGALNTFAALEKTYPGTAVMPDAVELARQLVASLKTAVDRAIPEQKVRKAEYDKGLKDAGPDDQKSIAAAYKLEQDKAEAEMKAAEKAGRWAPFNRNSEKCLTSLQAMADKEKIRLAALSPDQMRQSVQLAKSARLKAATGDLEPAANGLKESLKLWPANELAQRTEKEMADAKSKKPTQAAPTPTPTPAKATPAPAKPKHATSAITPLPATPVAVEATSLPEEPKKPFYLTLRGSITVVVGVTGVLAGANILVKIKQRNTQIV